MATDQSTYLIRQNLQRYTIVNRTLPSLLGGSLKITLTVPLKGLVWCLWDRRGRDNDRFCAVSEGEICGKDQGVVSRIYSIVYCCIIFKILFLYINDVNVQYKYFIKHLMIFQIFLFLKYVHEPHVEFMRKLPKKILKRLKRV